MARVPTLTSAGWVGDVVTMATTLMDYFLASENSQSELYHGSITSLPYLIQQFGHNPDQLEEEVQSRLHRYLIRYFDGARVNARTTDLEHESGRYNLTLDVMLTKDGKQHSLGRLIQVGESRILNVSEHKEEAR